MSQCPLSLLTMCPVKRVNNVGENIWIALFIGPTTANNVGC